MNKIKLAIIVTKLELGGAQKVAISLCEKLDKNKFETVLICGCGGILDEETKNKIRVIFIKDLIREINPIKDLKALFSIYKILYHCICQLSRHFKQFIYGILILPISEMLCKLVQGALFLPTGAERSSLTLKV